MAQKNDLLKVKVKSGTFYISSKEDKGEDWERNEFPNPQNKNETLVRYHRELSLKGNINYLAMQEDKYAGNVVSIIINNKEDNESYNLQIPIMDTGGSVRTTNQYFNSVAGVFKHLRKGDYVTMFVNNKNKDKNDRFYKNIVVLDEDGKLVKSDFKFTDSPRWSSTEKTDEFGKVTKEWDATETNKWYIAKFNESLEAFNSEAKEPATNNNADTSAPKERKVEPQEAFSKEEETDSLPF